MELWIRTGPHRIDISDDNSYPPEVLRDWANIAITTLVTLDRALADDATDTDLH